MPSSGRLFDWRWPQFLKDRAVKIGVGNNDLWGLHRTLTCRFLGQRKGAKQSRTMGKHIAGHMGLGCSHGSPRPTSPASFLAVKEGPAMGESCKCISIILGRCRAYNAFHLYIFEGDDLWSNQNTYTISPVPVGKTMKPGSFFFHGPFSDRVPWTMASQPPWLKAKIFQPSERSSTCAEFLFCWQGMRSSHTHADNPKEAT
jgi:hypothetical protein